MLPMEIHWLLPLQRPVHIIRMATPNASTIRLHHRGPGPGHSRCPEAVVADSFDAGKCHEKTGKKPSNTYLSSSKAIQNRLKLPKQWSRSLELDAEIRFSPTFDRAYSCEFYNTKAALALDFYDAPRHVNQAIDPIGPIAPTKILLYHLQTHCRWKSSSLST